MITHYGYDNFFGLVAAGVALMLLGVWLSIPWLSPVLYIVGFAIIVFALWFFRDPVRSVPEEARTDDSIIIAPADGKVVLITPVQESRLIQGKAIQISIFLSPLDVHVNRAPASGTVVFTEYNPGKFRMAFDHMASEVNEQSIIGLKNSRGALVFKQITGFLARRIVYVLKPGDTVKAGDKFGMMKFGCRWHDSSGPYVSRLTCRNRPKQTIAHIETSGFRFPQFSVRAERYKQTI
jgi:phosphatidylserine decarboxylase